MTLAELVAALQSADSNNKLVVLSLMTGVPRDDLEEIMNGREPTLQEKIILGVDDD